MFALKAGDKTFPATICFDPINFDWVEIRSDKTGAVMTLEMEGRDPSEFTGVEAMFWKDLTEGVVQNGEKVNLRKDYGDAFKAMCSRNLGTAEIEDANTATRIADVLRTRSIGVGADELDRRIDALGKFKKAAEKRYRGVSYDIPVAKVKDCPYPRAKWRRTGYAFFLQASFAVVEEPALEMEAFASTFRLWRRHGISYNVLPRTEQSGNHDIRKIAARDHHDTLVEYHTRLIDGIIRADKSLADAAKKAEEEEKPLTEKEHGQLVLARHSKARGFIREATKDYESAVKFAEEYEITECLGDLLEGLRAAIRFHAHAFNETAYHTGIKGAPTV